MASLRTVYHIDGGDVSVDPVHTDSNDKRPFIWVSFSHGFELWGHDAAAFRRIAVAMTEAADTLERTAEQLRAAEPEAVR